MVHISNVCPNPFYVCVIYIHIYVYLDPILLFPFTSFRAMKNQNKNNSIVVTILALFGILFSIWCISSPKYFNFVALRNDTFFDADKKQKEPFEFATEANVGLFRYVILDVYEYPWPPTRERQLFEDQLMEELTRLERDDVAVVDNTKVEDTTVTDTKVDDTPVSEIYDFRFLQTDETNITETNITETNVTETNSTLFNETLANETEIPTNFTVPPIDAVDPTPPPTATLVPFDFNDGLPDLRPGAEQEGSLTPTTPPTPSPTITNPNDIVADTVDIGEVKRYPKGMNQFDSLFKNAQRGSIFAPIFALLGVFFGLIELLCCTYKCSWLPTAVFLYLAFMFQSFTLFLFLSEDFWYVYHVFFFSTSRRQNPCFVPN